MDKRKHLQQMVLVKLDVNMKNNENRSIYITMHKTRVQMDQRPQNKTNHTEPHRRESGKQL